MERYHYGQTIKKYRELRGWTQAKLAERWPGKQEGANTRYIQDIEYGAKRIGDPETLRALSILLTIPLWEFGLSEYNPFNPMIFPDQAGVLYPETLDLVEDHIRQIWSLRCAARMPDAAQGVRHLTHLFSSFNEHLSPPTRVEQRFQLLSAQVERLHAVMALEKKQYTVARVTYEHMVEQVKHLESPASLAIALMEWGKELERTGEKHTAVALLEEARDVSLSASKRVIAFVHSYLARVYASQGDALRFERAISTGLTVASLLSEQNEDEDFVYSWSPFSAILAEQSWGYLNLGQSHKTLGMKAEIEQAIEHAQDTRLHAWIPLDWAHAYLQLGEPEEGVRAVREFYNRAKVMQSPHAISKAAHYLQEIEQAGYSKIQAVKDFREELLSHTLDRGL